VSRFKVTITDLVAPGSHLVERELGESGLDIEVVYLDTRAPEEIIRGAGDADGLIVGDAPINRYVIEHLDRCRVISRYGIGVDRIDLQAAAERGIVVCNVPDYCIEEVSTHAVAFLLYLNRRVDTYHRHVRSGQWSPPPAGLPARLQEQVLGIVGLGNIGKAVVPKAQGLGLCVLAYDPYIAEDAAGTLGIELVGLEELLRRSDYVSLHCPLNEETYHLIGQAELGLMKRSAFLINLARGPIVDQRALCQALTSGTIAGAALDVLEQEPPPVSDPLLQLENVLITPHVASWSKQSLSQLRRETARNVVAVLKGETPRSVANGRELHLPYPKP